MRRPRRQLIAIGIAYETPSATTDALTIALNALVDPKKISPNIRTTTTVRPSASRGTSSLLWTREKKRENGKPPSRANAMGRSAGLHSARVSVLLTICHPRGSGHD